MRDFLKYTFASLLGCILFFALGTGGLLALLIAVAARDTGPQVKNKSVLVFDLSTDITDAKPDSSTSRALQEAISGDDTNRINLRTVLDTLKSAAEDNRIVGLYLHGSMDAGDAGSGFATLKEVREALQRFRATGKPIIAYDMDWHEREYYLGSTASTVVLNPSGEVEMNGLQSEGTFLAGALQKFGVGVQVTRVGKYKSAVEPFLRRDRSPENREQTEKLLGDVWSEFLTGVSQNRKNLSPQKLQAIADTQGILMPEEALKAGLVDKVAYFDEVLTDLKKLTGSSETERTFRQINLRTYATVAEKNSKAERDGNNQVAVVYAEGEIVSGQGGVGEIGGDRLARQLRELRLNKNVKAIVLRVNSPGGSASASDVIQREVILASRTKPVIVSMGTVAASGGYWISTYANRIFAEPNTITGSIGVFGLLPNIQKLANDNGITWDVVKTGRFADLYTLSRPKNPQELAMIQKTVDQIYDQFVTKVAESRKLPKATVAEIAQGRVWSGQKAKDLKLVDELGGLEDAIKAAAKQANLGDDWHIEEYPRTRSLEERLLKRLTDTHVYLKDAEAEDQEPVSHKLPTDPFTRELNKFQQDLAALRAMNDPRGIYVRLPYNLHVE